MYNKDMLSDRINGSGMRTRLSSGDWSAAALVAGVVTLVCTLWPYPMPHPCVWQDLAEAAGLRSPTAEFPGLAPFVLRIMFDCLGAESGYAAVILSGHLLAGVTAGLWYFVFRQLLEFGSQLDMADRVWNGRICPALSAAGALLVAFSEPVWTSSQTLTSAGVDLFLSAFAMSALFRFLACGRRPMGVLTFVLFGALAAETPFGLLLLLPTAVLFVVAWRMIDTPEDIEPVLRFPVLEEFPWLLLIIAWVVGAGVTWAVADSSFRAAGGVPGSLGETFFAWARLAKTGTTLYGLGLGLAVTVLPLVVLMSMFPRLTHPLSRKPMLLRLMCLLAGLVAAAQLSDIPALRYRTWSQEDEAVAVTLLPGLLMAAAGAAAVLSAASFAAMAWCHDTRGGWLVAWLERSLLCAVVLAVVGAAGYGRQCFDTRSKLSRVEAHVVRMLEGSKGTDTIVSQGRLDAMLELRARCLGRKLVITEKGE